MTTLLLLHRYILSCTINLTAPVVVCVFFQIPGNPTIRSTGSRTNCKSCTTGPGTSRAWTTRSVYSYCNITLTTWTGRPSWSNEVNPIVKFDLCIHIYTCKYPFSSLRLALAAPLSRTYVHASPTTVSTRTSDGNRDELAVIIFFFFCVFVFIDTANKIEKEKNNPTRPFARARTTGKPGYPPARDHRFRPSSVRRTRPGQDRMDG